MLGISPPCPDLCMLGLGFQPCFGPRAPPASLGFLSLLGGGCHGTVSPCPARQPRPVSGCCPVCSLPPFLFTPRSSLESQPSADTVTCTRCSRSGARYPAWAPLGAGGVQWLVGVQGGLGWCQATRTLHCDTSVVPHEVPASGHGGHELGHTIEPPSGEALGRCGPEAAGRPGAELTGAGLSAPTEVATG